MQTYTSYIIRTAGDATSAFCVKCGQDQPLTAYYSHSKRGDGATRYRPYCKSCRCRGPRTAWSRPVHAALLAANLQKCKFCNVEKPLIEFYANGCFKDGVKKYRTRCKLCVLVLSKQTSPAIYKAKSQIRSASPKNFISSILNHASQRKQHLAFNIDLAYLLELYNKQDGLCALSGVNMTYTAGNGRTNTNISIDRIDSAVGYSRGNVQFVCDLVNRMKQDLPEEDLFMWCRRILKL
jgi:hypothetical protein